ncbi:hypothetical protein [Sulfurospirillum barnesii]|uniref:Uncharacterized protein n=1 Tax=Sulfurospirillum barnesii (strain ATCC 700032 / DSM 10660 / SES-3) TaxID=760154 RepID=I3XWE3_SULBS|nr:hypothetical protein [Sulfurospirillum barnesii]AFL68267.1 hypothetical protein Sulba_0966 [Sulfurospirillum barnesii SES-3]
MQDKIYPHYIQQAYQAKVLLRKIQIHSVGTRYPFKDQLVITTQNIERNPNNPIFSITHLIDVVVKCENRIEAVKLNNALKEYLAKDKMLPLDIGVFQKPFTKENQQAQKYYAFSNSSAKELLELLLKYQDDKTLHYVVGSSPVESNYLFNGFDLTYTLTNYTMNGSFFTLEQMKEINKNATSPSYKLKLLTTSFCELDEDTSVDESVNFEISGESESEVGTLAEKIIQLQNNGIAFTCKGRFPRAQKDYFTVPLSKSAGELIKEISALLDSKKPQQPTPKVS